MDPDPRIDSLLRRHLGTDQDQGSAVAIFEQKVEEKIAQRKADALPRGSRWARVAAGLLPPTLLAGKQAMLSSPKLGAAGVAAVFTAPVIALLMVAAALGFGTRFTRRPDASRIGETSEEESREQVRAWWRRHWRWAAAMIVGIVGMLVFRPTEALLILAALTIVYVAFVLRALSAAGIADRTNVGRTCAGMLLWMGSMSMSAGQLLGAPNPFVLCALLMSGAFVCFVIVLVWNPGSRGVDRMDGTKIAAVTVLLSIMAGFLVLVLYLGSTIGQTIPATDQVESLELDEYGLEQVWSPWIAVVEDPDWSVLDEAVARELGEKHPHKGVIEVAFYLDRLPAGALARFRAEAERAILGDGDLVPWYRLHSLELLSLVVDPDRTEDRTRDLVRRLSSTLPPLGWWDGLVDMAHVVILLERLGATAEVEALRAAVHERLAAHWLETDRGNAFDNGVLATERGGDGKGERHLNVKASWWGVWLIERYGAPETVDLDELRVWLEGKGQSREDRKPFTTELEADAARLVLERYMNYGERGIWERLLEDRVLLAVLLLVAFCVGSTLLAPPHRPRSQPARAPDDSASER